MKVNSRERGEKGMLKTRDKKNSDLAIGTEIHKDIEAGIAEAVGEAVAISEQELRGHIEKHSALVSCYSLAGDSWNEAVHRSILAYYQRAWEEA